ncbi:uncharacterized protein ACR2FA_007313 [Aphomia sociella]
MADEPSIWDYFEKPSDQSSKRATCRLCNISYSYFSTTANLRMHLEHRHSEEITLPQKKDRPPRLNPPGKYKKIIWGYFSQVEGKNRLAACNLCDKICSYLSTTTNLKSHLRRKHPDAYNRFIEFLPPDLDDVSKEVYFEYSDDDEDSDSPTKQNDLNCYFELETGGRVRCVVCRASLPQRQDAQRAHLQEKHPKLIEEQDQDEPMPFHSDDEPEQDNYTEVIYLEDARNVEKSPHKGHTSKISKWCNVKPQKRREIKKRDSTTSDEYVLKKRKNEDTDELTDFVKYISCLLRKLPSETCMKLQMDIVNLIMNATLNNQCASTVNVAAPSTSFYSTVPDKVLQTAGQVTLENISASVGTSVATSEAGPSIIISSVTENNAQ